MNRFRLYLLIGVSFLPTGAFAQSPTRPEGNWFSEVVAQLVTSLGFGIIGLGLAVAVLAVIIFVTPFKNSLVAGTRFMFFAFFLVFIGAGIEIVKILKNSNDVDILQKMSLNLPDGVWEDFRNYRKQKEFGTAAPVGQDFEVAVVKTVPTLLPISVPKGECRFYFISTKPPGRLEISIESKDLKSKSLSSKGYYQTGTVCADNNVPSVEAKIQAKILNIDGIIFYLSYVAPVDPSLIQVPAPPPIAIPEIRKVACTGEFESNCAGPHDIFYTCKPPSDQDIASKTCSALGRTNFSFLRTNTKGGNNCGYSLIDIVCK